MVVTKIAIRGIDGPDAAFDDMILAFVRLEVHFTNTARRLAHAWYSSITTAANGSVAIFFSPLWRTAVPENFIKENPSATGLRVDSQ